MIQKFIFSLIVGIDAILLFSQIDTLSVSIYETSILYHENSFLTLFFNFLISHFGSNDYTIRVPIILFYLAGVFLFYEISKKYLLSPRNRLWLLLLYVMLPGSLSGALVLSHAFIVLFGLLLYIYLDQRVSSRYTNVLLLFYSVLDGGFGYLFFGLIVYNLFVKDYINLVFNFLLLIVSVYLYKLQIYGFPSGHFLDAVGVYSTIFTPVVFVYLVYSLYRKYLADKIDKIWYITTTTLVASFLISFRQRIEIEYFAPYLMIALPLMAQTFVHSYRVRLNMFRRRYKIIFLVSFVFLVLNTLIVIFNQTLYLFLDNPKKHFAYNMNVAKELAQELEKKEIYCVETDKNMQERLKFYGISICEQNILKKLSLEDKSSADVTIRYKDVVLYKANVTNVYKKQN